MANAFYEALGEDRYRSTEHTVGPWDPGSQHAGPPSALLGRALEREVAARPGTLARISVDILGAVPVAELTLRTRTLRPGRSVELVEGELDAGGRTVLRAQAWRIRAEELELPAADPVDEAADAPPAFPATDSQFYDWPGGYLRAMQWRWAPDPRPRPGRAAVWGRMGVPLVPDEEPTGLQRVLAVADSGSGVSHRLPPEKWVFVNTELTVHLAAAPAGEWICLDATTRLDPGGFGLASTRIYDRDRLVGLGAQTLFVARR